MVGKVECGPDRTAKRKSQVDQDEPELRRFMDMARPEQYFIHGNIEGVEDGHPDDPSLQVPYTIGIGGQEETKQGSERQIREGAREPVTEDDEAEVGGITVVLQHLGEIGKREDDEQDRYRGKERAA